MAKIVYLKKGEEPPKDFTGTVIRVKRRGSQLIQADNNGRLDLSLPKREVQPFIDSLEDKGVTAYVIGYHET